MRRRSPVSAPTGRIRWIRVVAPLSILLAVMSAAGHATAAPPAQAEPAGKIITLGESLSEAQESELLEFFEKGDNDTVTQVTAAETADAMKGIFDYDVANGAFSSTSLTCRELGEGLDVTTRNIISGDPSQPAVTPGMYAIALVTAGIGDVTLVVAAPNEAPARGLTALAGVFKSWDVAPCESGSTTEERQRLALEELTLTSEIGGLFVAGGVEDGVRVASRIVLETQKNIVVDGLTKQNAIELALTTQERLEGTKVPPAERRDLVDLFVRLAEQDIDWSTFALGWNIEYPDANRITMTGEGIAIRNAQATATAEAARQMTATAQAEAALTATAAADAANATATAEGQLTATAEAKAALIAALTATAAAIPTATPVPTATPGPSTLTGTIEETGPGEIVVQPADAGAKPVRYAMDEAATVTRDGQPVPLAEVIADDEVSLVVNGGTKRVTELTATAPPVSVLERLRFLVYLLPLGLIIPVVRWVITRKPQEPFVVKRVTA